MTSSLTIRRSVAALASASAVAALTLVPTAAHAGVAVTFQAAGLASASFTGSGGGSCMLSSAPGSDTTSSTPVAFGRGTKHRSANLSATFTNSLDASDQVRVKGNVKSTLTLRRKGGGLKSLDLSASGAVSITHTTIGSQCAGSGEMFGEIPDATFTESKKGTLTVSYDTSKPHALAELVVLSVKTGNAVVVVADVGNHTHGTASAVLKPGRYEITETETGIFSGLTFSRSASLSHKTSMDAHVHATFTPKKHH